MGDKEKMEKVPDINDPLTLGEIINLKVNRGPFLVRDKSIFVTGGTGFLGSVVVEKILRTLTPVRKVYLLVRPKKGKTPQERLKDLFKGPLFDVVRKEKGEEIFKKVELISGDVCQLRLGMSDEDRRKVAEEVHLILHFAATIRFDEALKKAVLLNVRGVKFMMDLAKECKKLEVFIHVSTAYCHLGERVIYEKPYPPPADPYKIIQQVEWLDEGIVEAMTKKLLGKLPNTYAFTKALGEGIACDNMDTLPVVIVRPSVVIPIWLDPLPGWTDNINGPTGLLIAAGKGVLRSMYCNKNSYADFVPADIAANSLLLVIGDFYRTQGKRRIYNLTSSSEYKFTWDDIIEIGRKVIEKRIPLNGVAWYPGGSMKSNRLYHNICVFFFHYIPAVLIDTFAFILGFKPFMLRIQRRISKGFEVFEYYANNQWDFCNDESLASRAEMNEDEKKIYKVDGAGLDLEEYFYNCTRCARLYILKESDESIPAAKRHMKVMWVVDQLAKILFAMFVMYSLYKYLYRPLFETGA